MDWVQATFKDVEDPYWLAKFLFLPEKSFFRTSGQFGYKSAIRLGNIVIFYDGEDMGCHLHLSGQGCREYESLTKLNWSTFFALIFNMNISVSRLDLSLDVFKEYFTIDQVIRKVKRGHVRSRFKAARRIDKYNLEDGRRRGNTVYFGEPSSRLQIRFYDKKLERKENGEEVRYDFWNRIELQLRDQRAKKAANLISEGGDLGKFIKSVLKNYIVFVDPDPHDSNKGRWKISNWWQRFLGDIEKIKLTEKGIERSIDDIDNWFRNSMSATFVTLLESFDYDSKKLLDWISTGKSKMKEKHYILIEEFKKKKSILEFGKPENTLE